MKALLHTELSVGFGAAASRLARKTIAVVLATSLLCICLSDSAPAADATYSNVAADEHMKEWLVLGPIPTQEPGEEPDAAKTQKTGLEHDLLEKAGAEAKVEPKAGESLAARGGEYAWRLYNSPDDIVDLLKGAGEKEFVVAYAAAEIDSPQEETRLAGLGSDDGVRVWLNGQLVHENPTPRAVAVDDDIFRVKLRKGKNRLLIKVVNAQGDWGFSFRFLSQDALARHLFAAVSAGDRDAVEELLAHGIDANAKSPMGITAAQLAKIRGYDHVAELLVSKGAAPPEAFDSAAVLTTMLEANASENSPGVAALVARDGNRLFSKGFGMADLSNDVAISPKTKFRIGSVTKQFTAAAILKLQEDGKLSVSDKLSKYFPDFPRGDEVTIHHLLTHTSGIKSYTSMPDFFKTAALSATNDEMIDSFKDQPFDFDPGKKFAYNNSGYFLLGAIIEKVSGKSYNDYLREAFFEPLEMHDTGVHTATSLIKHEATGYAYEGGKPAKAMNWDMSRAGAAGSLYSTVEDLMRWNEGIFSGNVLSEKSLEAAFTPATLESDEEPLLKYGYGWIIGERRGLKTISHSGGLNGWMAELVRYVDQNTTVVVLHNSMPPAPNLGAGEVAELAGDAFLWQHMKPRPRFEVDESVNPDTFAAYVGRYDYMGAVMNIVQEGTQLTAQLTGQPSLPIFPMGGAKFFWKVVDAQIEFLTDDKGQVISARHTQGGLTFVAKRLPDIVQLEVDEATLDRYVGKYQYPGLGVLTVRRDGAKLLAQMTGQPEFEIYPKARDEFVWKVVAAEIKFVVDDEGQVEKAIHKQAGATIEAKRID